MPAGVALSFSEASQVETRQRFTAVARVISTKPLTNLVAKVAWDPAALAFESAVGVTAEAAGDGAVRIRALGSVPDYIQMTFFAKDQHTITETQIAFAEVTAYDLDGLAASVSTTPGRVYLTDSNVPVSPEMSVYVNHARAKSGETFALPITVISLGQLAHVTVTVEWDAARLDFLGAATVTEDAALSATSRRLTFNALTQNEVHALSFRAREIAGLQEASTVRLTTASGVGAVVSF